MQVRQMIAAVIAERQQVRKVRASQGRITSGGGDSKDSATEMYRQDLILVRLEGQCKRLPPCW